MTDNLLGIAVADPKTMDSAMEPLIASIINHQKEILNDLEKLEELSEKDKELIDDIRDSQEKPSEFITDRENTGS